MDEKVLESGYKVLRSLFITAKDTVLIRKLYPSTNAYKHLQTKLSR